MATCGRPPERASPNTTDFKPMGNLDLKFYLSIFLRRLPYFLVIAAFLSAVGIAVASILPPIYRSTRLDPGREPADPGRARPVHRAGQPDRADPDHRAAADDPGEPAEPRRAASSIYADQPDIAANAIVDDMRSRTACCHAPERSARGPGATILEVSFSSPEPAPGRRGHQRARHPDPAGERQRSAPTAPGTRSTSSRTRSKRLSGELDRLSQRIMQFKSANSGALPDSLEFRRNQQALNCRSGCCSSSARRPRSRTAASG